MNEPKQSDVEALVIVEGVVERIVYESADTNFMVGRMQSPDSAALLTFVGTIMAVSPGETLRLQGRWIEDKRFGRQLKVEQCQTILPSTVEGIEKYLGSGLVSGIGPKFAKRLVSAFGIETLRVIDEQPERLRGVPGIGVKRAGQIRTAWESQRAIQSIMVFLQGHGITTGQAVKIYKHYGDGAVAVLRKNPYRLAEDITGIAFRGADKIAAELGIEKDSPARMEAGILHVLHNACGEGHAFLPDTDLREESAALLGLSPKQLDAALHTLIEHGGVVREGSALYLPLMHATERGIAARLKTLRATPCEAIKIKMENALAWVEKTKKITLSPEQREAIRIGVSEKVAVITGGPGTGKTTILNGLLAILEKKGLSFLLAAPTGRAAKRMGVATDREALTIHRLLEFSPMKRGFTRDENNPLNTDLVVIDEASMVDALLMHALLRALPPFARLILVGDVDQLPSVGAGSVLFDTIGSATVPVVQLKTVFRQAAESGIITNAHRINSGEFPEFNTTDFILIQRNEAARAVETIVEVVVHRIPSRFGFDPMREIQVLSPMRRGEAGVTRLNEVLQEALNPGGVAVPRRNFRQGDKVMQLRNNYELDVYNGDVGIVRLVDTEAGELEVAFEDGRVVLYGFDQAEELDLAYAATVHKSQGSEYPALVLPFLPQHYMMLQRNLLYTAVTRGKSLVVLIGNAKAIGMAVRNSRTTRRNTMLMDRLRNTL
jgi:exodeoxyribonuclease V alpha subunit